MEADSPQIGPRPCARGAVSLLAVTVGVPEGHSMARLVPGQRPLLLGRGSGLESRCHSLNTRCASSGDAARDPSPYLWGRAFPTPSLETCGERATQCWEARGGYPRQLQAGGASPRGVPRRRGTLNSASGLCSPFCRWPGLQASPGRARCSLTTMSQLWGGARGKSGVPAFKRPCSTPGCKRPLRPLPHGR